MKSSYIGRQNSWAPIQKCKSEIPIMKGLVSPSIKCTRFHLTLAEVSAGHKAQGLSLEQGVIHIDLQKQKPFGSRQIYTAFSRVKAYNDLYSIKEFKNSDVKVNKDALPEYERMKQNDLFTIIKRNTISEDTLTVLLHNLK